MEDLTSGRHLATDVHGNVFVAHRYDLPALDDGLRRGTRKYDWDTPPWHSIQDVHVDADGLSWVKPPQHSSGFIHGLLGRPGLRAKTDRLIQIHILNQPNHSPIFTS